MQNFIQENDFFIDSFKLLRKKSSQSSVMTQINGHTKLEIHNPRSNTLLAVAPSQILNISQNLNSCHMYELMSVIR